MVQERRGMCPWLSHSLVVHLRGVLLVVVCHGWDPPLPCTAWKHMREHDMCRSIASLSRLTTVGGYACMLCMYAAWACLTARAWGKRFIGACVCLCGLYTPCFFSHLPFSSMLSHFSLQQPSICCTQLPIFLETRILLLCLQHTNDTQGIDSAILFGCSIK